MPKKKVKNSSSSKSLFDMHPNLKWLLPLLVLVLIAFLYVHHQREEGVSSGEEHSALKQELKQKLQMDNDEEINDDSMQKSSPSASPMNY
jgi:hypothetical protein